MYNNIQIEQKFGKDQRTVIKKDITYNQINAELKSKLWNQFKNLLGTDDYTANYWVVESEYQDIHSIIHISDVMKWQNEIRVFILLLLNSNLNPYTTAQRTSTLINFLIDTDCFSDELFPDFKEDPYEYCCSGDQRNLIKMFCSFINVCPGKYLDILDSMRFDNNVRDIPSFCSISKFDSIMKEIIETIDYSQPLCVTVLWWELTKVIPIRPIEFFTLRKNSFIKECGKYYVTVKRAKLQNREHNIPILDKLGISKHIFELFQKYISFYKNELPFPNSFLFSVIIFNRWGLAKSIQHREYIGSKNMYTLFYTFLNEIVCKQCGYTIVDKGNDEALKENEIEYFQYGDTRHIAFLNLLLSGFSPYTIAQIGGHTTIHQQLHYYDHLEAYLSSKAYTLATEARNSFKEQKQNFDIREKYALSIAKSNSESELQNMRKIEIGHCSSINFPYECSYDNCYICPHSIVDVSHRNMIQTKIKEYNNNIRTNVEFIKRIISNPKLGSDEDRVTAINAINCDTAAIAALHNKNRYEE